MPHDKFFCNNGCLITGMDISSRHITLARSNVPQATFILDDFSKLDLGKKFDGIISLYAIFHIPRRDQTVLLKRITAHLADGGTLLITLGTGDGYFEQDWCGSQMAWDQHDPDIYLDILQKTGLEIFWKLLLKLARATPKNISG